LFLNEIDGRTKLIALSKGCEIAAIALAFEF